MELTRTAFGIWNGGRFMHFGQPLDDDRFLKVIHHAYDKGIRTFLTADVYGNGQADEAPSGTISTRANAMGPKVTRASPIRDCASRASIGIT
jgi:aryl-alcohol dehydrogenase-like predicted oxidoreductase